jgi:parallel beta-helix repeat protein
METPCMLRSRRYYVGMLAALPAIGVLGTSGRLAATRGMTNVQTFGAKGDGVTDDTKALQNACNSGEVLFVPKTSAFYKTSQFLDLSKSVYSDGAEIRLAQDGTADRSIFRVVQNRAPLTIDGFILNGLYSGGTASDYSMGVLLYSATNITISNNTIKNNYDDNVYFGKWLSTVPCQNITVNNNILLNPRRNNVSLIFANRADQ